MGENGSGEVGSNERRGPTAENYYDVSVRLWEIQGNWFWHLWHYFLVANSILLVAFAALVEGTCAEGRLLCCLLSVAGILLGIVWHIVAVSHHVFQRMRVGQAREIEEDSESEMGGLFARGGAISTEARESGHYRFSFERDETDASKLLVSWPWWWRCLGLHRWHSSHLTTSCVPLGMALLWFVLLLVALFGDLDWASARRVIPAALFAFALGAGTVWLVSRLRKCCDEDR